MKTALIATEKLWLYGIGGCFFFSTFAAVADQTEGNNVLQEIVVTAQKRAEDIDKVPISISVFDRAAIAQRNMQDIADIANSSPGIDYVNQGSLNSISIRGIYTNAGSSTTGIYIDDVPIQIRQTALDLYNTEPKVFDLDRVEVLRGPQGTLFGAGAEGGILRFITPEPSLTQFNGYVRAGVAMTDNGDPSYESGGAFGGPIVADEIGFRVSAWHRRDGGYIDHDSPIPGGYRENSSNWSDSDVVRAAFMIAPSESVKITPSIFYQHIYTNDLPLFDPAGSSVPGDTFTQNLSTLGPEYSNVSAGLFVNPLLLKLPSSDQFVLPALKADFNLGLVEVLSSTSYLHRDFFGSQDFTNLLPYFIGSTAWPRTAQAAAIGFTPNDQRVFTEELRAQSSDSARPLQWTLGVFFTRARQITSQAVVSPYFPTQVQNILGAPIEAVLGQGQLPGNISYLGIEPDTVDTQLAVFGQVTYHLLSRVSLTAGARVARESSNYTFYQNGPLVGPTAQTFNGEQTEHVLDPKFGINVQLNSNSLLYFTASKGDRIGGVNPPLLNIGACNAALAALGYPNGAPLAYQGDSVWSYEVGSKNRLFDERAQIEASVFHIDWTGIQQSVGVSPCGESFTANLGKANSDGFEFQLTGLVTDALKIGLSMGYTNAKDATSIDLNGASISSKGAQINPYASPWLIAPSAEYTFALGRTDQAYFRLDDTFHSKNPGPFQVSNPTSPSYNPGFIPNPSYNQLNAHLGTTWSGWDVDLYALNVLNSHPLLYNTSLTPTGTVLNNGAFTIRPLSIGATVSFRW